MIYTENRYRMFHKQEFPENLSILDDLKDRDGIGHTDISSSEFMSILRHLKKISSESADIMRIYDEYDNGISLYYDNGLIYDLRIEISRSSQNREFEKAVWGFAQNNNLLVVRTDGRVMHLGDNLAE